MFGSNLKVARKNKHLTLEQLADLYNETYIGGGLSKGTLSKYENNKQEPMITVVKNLSSLLDVTVDFLLDKKTDLMPSNILPIETHKVPLLGDIACGKPIFASEDRESYVEVGTDIKADFCLKAKGDSMINARIMDGDIVFIRQQPMVDNGEIAAVIIGDSATLKRVYYYKDKSKLVLQAENPEFEPLVYVNEELENINILGKAIAFQSDVK